MDALLSSELLLNIFWPNSPLHDGAIIIHGDRVVAAGVVLPLSQSPTVEHIGTRHRAAIGITEISDAIAVVVSEETGTISLANAGRMVRNLGEARLQKVLSDPGSIDRLRHQWSARRLAEPAWAGTPSRAAG